MNRSILTFATLVALGLGLASAQGQSGLTGRIAYQSGSDLYLKNLADGSIQRLTATKISEYFPKLSPDGTKIAFAVTSAKTAGIYVINSDGTGRTQLTTFGIQPAWSPDRTKIAFVSNGIWVADVNGGVATQLTSDGFYPAWSPDGSQIAFCSDATTPDMDIWIMNWDGSNAHVYLSLPGDDMDVVWSGLNQLAFCRYVDRSNGFDIFTYDPATGTLTRLARAGDDWWPSWSPDGTRIAFSGSSRSGTRIYTIKTDGSELTYLVDGWQPHWGQ